MEINIEQPMPLVRVPARRPSPSRSPLQDLLMSPFTGSEIDLVPLNALIYDQDSSRSGAIDDSIREGLAVHQAGG